MVHGGDGWGSRDDGGWGSQDDGGWGSQDDGGWGSRDDGGWNSADDGWGSATTYRGDRPTGSPPSDHRSAGHRSPDRPKRRGGGLLAVVVVIAVVAAIGVVAGIRLSGRHHDHPAAGSRGSSHPAAGGAGSSHAGQAAPPGAPVHVSLFEGDGQTYGIGMPIIAQFSKKVTDAHAFDKAVTVKVNGQPADGAWFWVNSSSGYAMEAHYRPQQYWPAHSKVEMSMPLKGVSAGKGLTFDDSLTLNMNIGAAHVSRVDGAAERMTVTSDGQTVNTFPVSLGQASTPTYLGTKVVMAKKNPQLMVSTPGEANPYRLEVPWSVRLTNSGEFVHAAAWNTGNIGSRSTSHGCTNLTVADAQWFYNFSLIGDVVTYVNTGTSEVMPSWDGFGDWNITWSEWQAGNLLKN